MGLLGADVLSRFSAVRIDFGAQRLTLAGPEGAPVTSVSGGQLVHLSGELTTGTLMRVPMDTIARSVPVPTSKEFVVSDVRGLVLVTVGSVPDALFLVDTGAGVSVVAPTLAKQASLVASGPPEPGYAGLACPVTVHPYTIGSWSLDGTSLLPQVVGSNNLPAGQVGLLGAGTLERYNPIVVDYRDGDLLLSRATGT